MPHSTDKNVRGNMDRTSPNTQYRDDKKYHPNSKGNNTKKAVRDMSTMEKVGEIAGAFAKDVTGPVREGYTYAKGVIQGKSQSEIEKGLRK
jgi:hypothetical protein